MLPFNPGWGSRLAQTRPKLSNKVSASPRAETQIHCRPIHKLQATREGRHDCLGLDALLTIAGLI